MKALGPLLYNRLNMTHEIRMKSFSLVLANAFVHGAVHLKQSELLMSVKVLSFDKVNKITYLFIAKGFIGGLQQ